MAHLPGGVHARVGAAGDGQPNRHAQDRRQGVFEDRTHGPLIGLPRPAREVRAVVTHIEPQTDEPAAT